MTTAEQMDAAQKFVNFVAGLKGDEKSEAQTFLNRFFQIFGYDDVVGAGGVFEARIKPKDESTKYADCLFAPPNLPGVLIEMKSAKERNLETHWDQVKNYWVCMNPSVVIRPGAQKPRYIVLCNFDEFIIYDYLSRVDTIKLKDLPHHLPAFSFMQPGGTEPIFECNTEAISKDVTHKIGEVFKHEVFDKKEEPTKVSRFLLQCVLAMFSEDFGLLPNGIFTSLVEGCATGKGDTYDELGGLFRQMANKTPATGGKYKGVPYFNGGLFKNIDPLSLDTDSCNLLLEACKQDWNYVNPAIFGSLFEGTLDSKERHKYGSHFTSERDMQKIISPTIVKPWSEKIDKANSVDKLKKLLSELSKFRVLDPACGSGNFLFVSYLALVDIELRILDKMSEISKKNVTDEHKFSVLSTKQFFGIEIQRTAVEIAKVSMMLAKEIGARRWREHWNIGVLFELEYSLPLDNMDKNILCQDALLEPWPDFDVVVGNPPYQSKNKMKEEMDNAYIEDVRGHFPEVSGMVDYCVYWFRKAHSLMKKGQRAGLVGTNTIRQNYSREGGLDYIVDNGGTITDAVSTQKWSGDAVVCVSIVNWVKGESKEKKTLITQDEKGVDSYEHPAAISSSLTSLVDVRGAYSLKANDVGERCSEGQTPGLTKAFTISVELAKQYFKADVRNKEVMFPFLIGRELTDKPNSQPTRYVIDFRKQDIFEAQKYGLPYKAIEKTVLTARTQKAEEKKRTNAKTLAKNPKAKVNKHHDGFLKNWWKLVWPRPELMDLLEGMDRYIACSRVTKRPIFEFISSEIHPSDALQVFAYNDDYTFGILSSTLHWIWFNARCSTMKNDPRYTPTTVFNSFPWPQNPKASVVAEISKCAVKLRVKRREIMENNKWTLRDLYREMEKTPNNPVSDVQKRLDTAVGNAYGLRGLNEDKVRAFLLDLNRKCHEAEERGEQITPPGFPPNIPDKSKYVSEDKVVFMS